jgi:hypothetical protein
MTPLSVYNIYLYNIIIEKKVNKKNKQKKV